MSKALVIAEKPSVAADIARALGGCTRQKDYFENESHVISSAIGHLLEIVPTEGSEPKRGKWKMENLPVIPDHFDLQPIEKTAARLKLLLRLARRKDVAALINACDAGREGELIFRHIVRYAGCRKPIRRLWLQSMTTNAIREGFDVLREGVELEPLANAAVCRSESDWLVGINGTRAMTAFNSRLGGFHLTTVGRVQTPTLAIVVEREERIKKFDPRTYWELHGTFQAEAGVYSGRWFDPDFRKGDDEDARAERQWDRERAEAIRARCQGQPGTVSEDAKPTTQLSPLLFDLTSLQREANTRFGLSARRTLQLAQALYERYKLITYPRTDSRALPEDYPDTVRQVLESLSGSAYPEPARMILDQGWVRPNRRIFNNAKISDHFAIIPTVKPPGALPEYERKIYDLIARRFLAVFFPAAEYLVTVRITRVAGENFKSEGKVLVNPGWLAVYGKQAAVQDGGSMAPVASGETVQTTDVDLKEAQTRPPPRFSEATLLSAMEGAGKLLDDEELREAMLAKGLGTPATRASIIEGLIYERYIVRQGRELQPTAKAFSLITLLRGLAIPELCSPELTGNWEFQLKQIERAQLDPASFMREIIAMTRSMVAKAKSYKHDTIPGDFGVLRTPCPKCGGVVCETYKKFQCRTCDFSCWKTLAGRQFELEEMEQLIERREVGPLDNFRNQRGRVFSALVRLNDQWQLNFDFGRDENEDVAEDFSGQQPLGRCPKCGDEVFAGRRAYVCAKASGAAATCDFRTGATILRKVIEPEQIRKLLATGRTDLLEGFISKKGRPFRAFLAVQDGQVKFEFAPKAGNKAAAAKGKVKKDETEQAADA
ncbi:MAG: DNA topoisomerase III [Kiritimatiellia bacterium]|nr:DNA topoisomerase III [Lentisphaerota bacterium]